MTEPRLPKPRLPEPGSLAEQVRMLCAEQLTRRRFLIGAGAASVLAVAACRPVAAPTPGPQPTPGPPSSVSSRVLVVLEMAGGHDGYSMFIPYKNPTYYQLRPTVSVPAAQVIPIAGQNSGLHPNLVKLQHRNLAFVDGVGPSHPNDSHFDMIKRWWEADTDGAHQSVSGFFGRLCDAAADPNAAAAGLCIAWRTTPALVASTSTTLSIPPDSDAQYPAPWDPTLANSWMTAQRAMAVAGSGAPPADKSARSGITTAIKFADATVHMPGPSAVYPNTGLGQQLSLAARLIRTQIGLKVIYLPWDGPFDSHSDHRGNHDPLMTELDNALDTFLGDMQANGLANQVVVASMSEFGRRADQNTNGLDHGTTSAMFLAGAANGGVYGQAPNWSALDSNGNLVSPTNLADYYATLAQWLGVPASQVLAVPGTPIAGLVP